MFHRTSQVRVRAGAGADAAVGVGLGVYRCACMQGAREVMYAVHPFVINEVQIQQNTRALRHRLDPGAVLQEYYYADWNEGERAEGLHLAVSKFVRVQSHPRCQLLHPITLPQIALICKTRQQSKRLHSVQAFAFKQNIY